MRISIDTQILRRAEFKLWVPPDSKKLRSILVLVPGSQGDGTSMVKHKVFQKFAVDNDVALVGCNLQDKVSSPVEGYIRAGEESGPALLKALDIFSGSHPQLKDLKLFLWGFSAGGEFNYEFNQWRPEKVAAFIVNKGGIYYTGMCSDAARKTPGLFFYGKRDDSCRIDVVKGLFALNERAGTNWDIVAEDCAHDVCNSDLIGLNFFEDILLTEGTC